MATDAVTNPTLATGKLTNDDSFVTHATRLEAVSNIDLLSAFKDGFAIGAIYGSIEISSIGAELCEAESRLTHIGSNSINVAKNIA